MYSPKVLQVIFCYCSCIWSVQLNKRAVHLYISYTCWFTVNRIPFCVFWSLHSWRGWCSKRHGVRRYHNGWHTNILGGLFQHVHKICLFLWWSFFWSALLKCLIIKPYTLYDIVLTEFCCIYIACIVCKKFLIPLQFKASYLTNFYSRHMQTQHMASRCHCEVEGCNRRLKLFTSTPAVNQVPCLAHGSSSDRNYIVLLCIGYNNSQQFPMNHDSEQILSSYKRQSINNGVVNGKKGLGENA